MQQYKVQLKVSDLRSFQQNSRNIKGDNTYPILAFSKLENNRLIKTNYKSYCQYKLFVDTGVEILIDDKILNGFLDYTTKDILSFEYIEENLIQISDGMLKMSYPVLDINLYPKYPDFDTQESPGKFSREVITLMNVAAQNTSELDNNHPLFFIHIKDGFIFSTDAFNMFSYNIGDKSLPEVILSPEQVAMINNLGDMDYFKYQNYNFFGNNFLTYGFVKPEVETPAFNSRFEFVSKDQWFEFEKFDLIKFCELTSKSATSKIPECILKRTKVQGLPGCSDGRMTLNLSDNDFHVGGDTNFYSSGHFELTDPIKFNHRITMDYMKPLPYSKMRFSPCVGALSKGFLTLWTTEDEKFLGIFSTLVV